MWYNSNNTRAMIIIVHTVDALLEQYSCSMGVGSWDFDSRQKRRWLAAKQRESCDSSGAPHILYKWFKAMIPEKEAELSRPWQQLSASDELTEAWSLCMMLKEEQEIAMADVEGPTFDLFHLLSSLFFFFPLRRSTVAICLSFVQLSTVAAHQYYSFTTELSMLHASLNVCTLIPSLGRTAVALPPFSFGG